MCAAKEVQRRKETSQSNLQGQVKALQSWLKKTENKLTKAYVDHGSFMTNATFIHEQQNEATRNFRLLK